MGHKSRPKKSRLLRERLFSCVYASCGAVTSSPARAEYLSPRRLACAFAGAYEAFKTANVVVIGISKDSVASHVKFAEKYALPFILLSDPERQAIEAYGVWQEKKNYGKVTMGVVRTTYIIDEQGLVEKVMPKVKPDTNAGEILEYLSGK